MIVDTHTHICDPVFDPDREAVLQRAVEADIKAILAIGETLDDAKKNIELASQFPLLKPGAGLYPTILEEEEAVQLCQFIRDQQKDLFCIGEVGLDFWKVKEEPDREVQKAIFRTFIGLSIETGLPLNVHSRSAGRHAIQLLLEEGAKSVQMHAFDGKASTALPAVEAGFYFSVPPSVVRSRQKQKLVRSLPLACLLVETDSPVLGSEPGVRNEPANAATSVRAIAEIKGVPEETVREEVLTNTLRLYGDL